MEQTGRRFRVASRRGGLSLLELLLVLTIMIALGGIAVSTLPGLLGRTQVATAASNVPQIETAIRQSAVIHNGRIGNRFDALVTGDGALNGGLPGYVGGANIFQTAKLGSRDVAALAKLGITQLVPANASAANATFESHNSEPAGLTAEASACFINSSIAAELATELFNIDAAADSRYLVMGIGSRSTLVGSGKEGIFAESPVHFSDDHASAPQVMYSRYLIVVELSGKDSNRSARYLGTCIPGTKGLQSISQVLQQHYDNDL